MCQRKKARKRKRQFFLMEGHKLNPETGKLEYFSKKVYWS